MIPGSLHSSPTPSIPSGPVNLGLAPDGEVCGHQGLTEGITRLCRGILWYLPRQIVLCRLSHKEQYEVAWTCSDWDVSCRRRELLGAENEQGMVVTKCGTVFEGSPKLPQNKVSKSAQADCPSREVYS